MEPRKKTLTLQTSQTKSELETLTPQSADPRADANDRIGSKLGPELDLENLERFTIKLLVRSREIGEHVI